MRRRPVALLVAAVSGLVLAGCGSGPSQVNAAAIIGDHVIPLGDVQQEMQWLIHNSPQVQQAQQQRKVDLPAREVMRGRIIHELVEVAKQREGLKVDEREVDRLIESSGGVDQVARQSSIEPERVRQVATDQILMQQLGEDFADRVSVRLVGTSIVKESAGSTAKDQALELGRKVAANPGDVQNLLRDNGHQVLDEKLELSEAMRRQPELAISAVFGSEAGSVLVVQPSQEQAGWLVALVRERTVKPAPKDPSSASQADGQVLYLAGLRQLQPIADELGVRLNPRYGVWDETGMAPAASEDEVTGYRLPSRTVQP